MTGPGGAAPAARADPSPAICFVRLGRRRRSRQAAPHVCAAKATPAARFVIRACVLRRPLPPGPKYPIGQGQERRQRGGGGSPQNRAPPCWSSPSINVDKFTISSPVGGIAWRAGVRRRPPLNPIACRLLCPARHRPSSASIPFGRRLRRAAPRRASSLPPQERRRPRRRRSFARLRRDKIE
jgi:hypothetical protein